MSIARPYYPGEIEEKRTPVYLTDAEMDAIGTFIGVVRAYEPRLVAEYPLRKALESAEERILRVALGFAPQDKYPNGEENG